MSWKKITDEKPGDRFRDRVLGAARQELAKSRSTSVEDVGMWRRRWLVGGAIAAVVAIVYRQKMTTENAPTDSFSLLGQTEMLENMELVERLDFFEDLDVMLDEKAESNG